jgi:hypothetical protein
MLTDAEAERLASYLVAKHRQLPVGRDDLECIVTTTVLDTLLVAEGSLTVDDFTPNRTWP